MKVKLPKAETALRAAAIGSLVSLALMVWSFLDPSPLVMVLAMSIGQALGLTTLGLFLAVVGFDIVKRRRSHPE